MKEEKDGGRVGTIHWMPLGPAVNSGAAGRYKIIWKLSGRGALEHLPCLTTSLLTCLRTLGLLAKTHLQLALVAGSGLLCAEGKTNPGFK